MTGLTSRQFWMATLAKASLLQLEQAVSNLPSLPNYDFLRPPEVGLAMVQGRAGGTGQPFYLGEMTLTRCVVRLETSDSEEAIVGFGYVAGRSHRHAELAALCDALLQHPAWHDLIQMQVTLPLQTVAQQQQEQQQRQAESTRVNFFHVNARELIGMIAPLPGFQDAVHDAQITFRTLLEVLAHPGRFGTISSSIMPPQGITPTCAAACLTVLDLETQVWLQPGLEIESWLRFHTGCRFTPDPRQANFALIWDVTRSPDLPAFNPGTAEYPELSTTLLIQVERLIDGEPIVLQGPGILGERAIAPQLPAKFWQQWISNHHAYPLGVDVFLFDRTHAIGLPRSTGVKVLQNPGMNLI